MIIKTNDKASRAIVEAARLTRGIKEAEEQVARLKEIIREEAEKVAKRRKDDEKVEFDSSEGVATVCFPKDSVSLIKGANPNALREHLPAAVWEHLFQVKVCLQREFEDNFGSLTKQQQNVVSKQVEWCPNTPRVLLPK